MKLGKRKARLASSNSKKRSTSKRFNKAKVRARLRTAVSSIESVFGNLSENISEIESNISTLHEDCCTLFEIAGVYGKDGDPLRKATEILDEPMRYFELSLQKQSKLGELISDCERFANSLLKRQNDMIETLHPLKFMHVFYKIEAPNLSSEHRNALVNVSEELTRFHQMTNEIIRENIRHLTDAKAKISALLKIFMGETPEYYYSVVTHRSLISDTSLALDKKAKENALQDTDLHRATQHFCSAIEGLVISLQTEDIFRQRCQSIIETLDQQPVDISNLAWALLQARKIERAAEEMRESSHDVKRNLDTILSQANQLEEISTAMNQFESMITSADDAIQFLLECFDLVFDLFTHGEKLSIESQKAIGTVRSLEHSVSDIYTEASKNIQFSALNAQACSTQAREARALKTLIARTTEISSQLREVGSETSKDIEKMRKIVNALSQSIDGDRKTSSVHAEMLNTDCESVIDNLRDTRNRTFDSLSKVATALGSVQHLVKRDYETLIRLPSIADELDSVALSIREKSGISSLNTNHLAKLETEIASHTKESEKTVHTSLSASKKSSTTLWDSNHLESASDLTIANDEVELF